MNEDPPPLPEVLTGESPVFQRLVVALTQAGVAFVHTHHPPVFTSSEAAAVRGTPLRSGAKALIVKGGEAFRMVVMPADMALNSNGFRKLLHCKKLRFATKDEVFSMTGLIPGSIPPFGSLFGLETICDERLAENDRINFNGGSHTESIQLSYKAYVAFESPRIEDVAKPVAAIDGR